MTLHPDKLPLIHALADGELDVANTLAIEEHLKTCTDCRAELDGIEALRGRLAPLRAADRAPAALRSRIESMLGAEVPAASRTRARIGGYIGSGAAGAIAACLALMIGVPQLTQSGAEDQMIQSHVRALLVDHAVDIQTSDRHVVKPWFNGKVDFAPPVPELRDQGFPLVGGRLDVIEGREVAAIVYRRRLHTINLFVRPAKGLIRTGFADRRDGYSVLRWSEGGLDFWAISDIGGDELAAFRQAYRAQSAAPVAKAE